MEEGGRVMRDAEFGEKAAGGLKSWGSKYKQGQKELGKGEGR